MMKTELTIEQLEQVNGGYATEVFDEIFEFLFGGNSQIKARERETDRSRNR